MSHHFELLADLPVLICSASWHLDEGELAIIIAETSEYLDALDQRVYYIMNAGDMQVNLEDISQAARLGAFGSKAPLHHPNIIEPIMVTTNPMMAMAARSMNVPMFHNIRTQVFSSLDDALAYIDSRL